MLRTAQAMLRADRRQRLVLVGTGWGNFRVLREIDPTKYAVSVISPRNHMLFTPLLSSAATGTLTTNAVMEPVRPLARVKRARYYEGWAIALDKEKRVVQCKTKGEENFNLRYDKLVIGCGFQPNDFGIKEVGQYAQFMKETGDAVLLHDRILRKFEHASYIHILDDDERLSPEEEEKIRRLLTFVIVGAGPTGTELCGELTDFIHQDVREHYPHLYKFATVHLVDGAPRVLMPFQDPVLQDMAAEHLVKTQGVKLHLNEFADKLTKQSISFKSGLTLQFDTLVWCAGIKPLPFVRGLQVTKTPNGAQIVTDRHLRVLGEEHIYAIGDCATVRGYWQPQTAQVAKQQALYLAEQLNLGSMHEFTFHNQGVMAYLGGHYAIIGNTAFFKRMWGVMGFLGWRVAYWGLQLSKRNMFRLAIDWLTSFFIGRDLARPNSPSRPQ